MVQGVRKRYIRDLEYTDVKEPAIYRRLRRESYSLRYAVALAAPPCMEIGYVVKDAAKWEMDTERDASQFDTVYYRKFLEAW